MTAAPLRIPARGLRQATVIFVHGLGQTNESWTGMIAWLSRHLPSIEWILPQAPLRAVTAYAGASRSSWFDIATFPPGEAEWDHNTMSASISVIESIIQTEVQAGIDSHRIILAGYSQGAALSLLVALTTLHELGGVASLSGWVPHQGR
ncbi:alpha/beta-hydrolase, partial [Artomyces pyxidatus]